MFRILPALVLLLCLAPLSSEAFVFKKIVYCSPIEGVVHWQGKPLSNLVVTRELYSGGFEGGKHTDTAITAKDGWFKFDVVQERRFLRPDLLSANPNISQLLWLLHDGQRYAIWSHTKYDFTEKSETNAGVIRIDCDLSAYEQYDHGRIVRCQHKGNI
ncbi:DUF6795 domain-containing protein [Limnobacter sp.]|uniref:DUF6795 domain-containing protein n=1 Tax=Limnobacter sp. TaxID=2003368 RepID=UPI0035124A77